LGSFADTLLLHIPGRDGLWLGIGTGAGYVGAGALVVTTGGAIGLLVEEEELIFGAASAY
jgi:hypothetical protein